MQGDGMTTRDKRRDERYPIQLAVRLFVGNDFVALRTEDVSFNGLFLRTDSPPKLRRLVRIEASLPNGAAFSAHGMAVHVVSVDSAGGRAPGVGVQFYAVDKQLAEVWHAFIRETKRAYVAAASQPIVIAPPSTPDPIRRRHPRWKVGLEVRYRTYDELYRACTSDVSRGGLFVATSHDLAVGAEVTLTLVRPESDVTFEVDGIVRRQVKTPCAGVGVEFIKLTPERQAALDQFLSDSIPMLDDLQIIEDGDPRLA